MTQANATLGPWNVSRDSASRVCAGPHQKVVAECTGYKGEREANAKLVALAPSLYGALKDLLELVGELEDIEHDYFGCDDPGCVVCGARNLLAEIDPAFVAARDERA